MQGSVSRLTTRAGAHLTMPSPQAFPSLGYPRALVCYPSPICHICEATESLDPLSCLPLPFHKPSPPPSFFLDPLWCCWVPSRLPSPLPYSSSKSSSGQKLTKSLSSGLAAAVLPRYPGLFPRGLPRELAEMLCLQPSWSCWQEDVAKK